MPQRCRHCRVTRLCMRCLQTVRRCCGWVEANELRNPGNEKRLLPETGIVEHRDVVQNRNSAMSIMSITGSMEEKPMSTGWCCYAARTIASFINPVTEWNSPKTAHSPCTPRTGGVGQPCPNTSRNQCFGKANAATTGSETMGSETTGLRNRRRPKAPDEVGELRSGGVVVHLDNFAVEIDA